MTFRELQDIQRISSIEGTSRRQPEREVFFELGEPKKKANITREGIDIPAIEVQEDRFTDFFADKPRVVNKVVKQSVAAGTVVQEGTTVDLVLAPPQDIPLGVYRGGHLGLADETMANVFERLYREQPEVQGIVAKRSDASDLTSEDRQVLVAVMRDQGIAVGEEPGQRVEDAFQSIQYAVTFNT